MSAIEWIIAIVVVLAIFFWFVCSITWFISSVSGEDSLKSLCLVDEFKAGNIFGKICVIMANILLLPWIVLYLLGKGMMLFFIGIFTLIVKLGGWKDSGQK